MIRRLSLPFVFAAALFAFGAQAQSTTSPSTSQANIVTAFSHVLPNAQGKSITGLVVTYKPGESTPPHRHGSAFVVGYVLSGAIRSQLENGKVKVYRVGDSWSEKPGANHVLSANASKTEPASLLAIFVSDSNAPAPVIMDKQ